MGAKAQTVRDQLHHLADELPTDATWKDVLYEAYFRQEVEAGLAEARRGEFATDEDVKATFAKWGIDLEIEVESPGTSSS